MTKKVTARKIVQAIWDDLCDRSGFDLGSLDSTIRREIRDTWQAKVEAELEAE